LATAPRCGLFVVDLAAKINGRRAARRFCEAALLHRVFACAKSYATIYGMFDDAQHDGAHLYVTTGSVLYGGGSVVRMKGERRSTPSRSPSTIATSTSTRRRRRLPRSASEPARALTKNETGGEAEACRPSLLLRIFR